MGPSSVTIDSHKPRRQIQLPLSKAAEIAFKNITLRLGRSLLVTSGIILAIAFWTCIRNTSLIEQGLRDWIRTAPPSERLAAQRVESEMQSRGSDVAGSRVQTRWLLGIAFLVAFAGILNATLMSVTERFREIGTMKCLGALDGFIGKLFLIEGLLQGVAGSIIGIVLGLLVSFVAGVWNYGLHAMRHVPGNALALAMLTSFAAGVALTVGGALYPAWQAARMQPVEAMRADL